jgi:FKBP-type peptidyl-prolyl cis-trans isomerase
MLKRTLFSSLSLGLALAAGFAIAQNVSAPTTQQAFPNDAGRGVRFNDLGRTDLEMKVQDGDKVTVLYEGRLEDGTRFDYFVDSRLHRAFTFTVGGEDSIKGMAIGTIGMRFGETREIYIPYDQAYGERGNPPTIPPKSNLIFNVTVVKIERGGK